MQLIDKILIAIERTPKQKDAYSDAMICLRDMGKDGLPYRLKLRSIVAQRLGQALEENDNDFAQLMYDTHRDTYFYGAEWVFEDYMIGTEYERPIQSQFYMPRRKQLHPIVHELQRLADGELDLLCISAPPGIGKSGLAIFFITWLAGGSPHLPILSGSHSSSIMTGVYEECIRLLSTEEYNWQRIFPSSPLVYTNAKDLLLDLKSRKKFKSLQFTSVGSGNAGKFRAMRLLYCDDLISSIEEALSVDRLDKLWRSYTDDLKQRKQGTCPELHIATRWSTKDVIGRLQDRRSGDDRAQFISIPALNDEGESNFDYPYGLGFSTKNYMDLKDSMEDASWRALFMNEPIEREGLLLNEDELNRYYELPLDREPDTIFCGIDTAESGKDYTALAIAFIYGKNVYIHDVVYDNSPPDVTKPQCAKCIYNNKALSGTAESNNAGGYYVRDVLSILEEQHGYRINMRTKFSTTRKETRIELASDGIKRNFYFKDKSLYEPRSQYGRFMNAITSYTRTGKNAHDDAIDVLSLIENEIRNLGGNRVEIFDRFI